MGRVEGKVAFITGVARGQGRSHAITLAKEGAHIIGLDFLESVPDGPAPPATEADLAETVRQVEAFDRRIIAEKADVRDFDQVKAVVDKGVAAFGRLDVVSANAGINSLGGTSEEISDEIWSNMINSNLTGVWHTTKAAIPHLKAGGRGGSIILTSSAAGLAGFPNMSHYVAAKHGVTGLMRALALELASDMIRVNSVHPSNVGTDMIFNEEMYRLFRPDVENPSRNDFAEAALTMHLLAVPWVESVDVSNAVLWLASDESRYITGVALPIDAGLLTKH
jgi:(+)-trans-carveol dehydrogenase